MICIYSAAPFSDMYNTYLLLTVPVIGDSNMDRYQVLKGVEAKIFLCADRFSTVNLICVRIDSAILWNLA